MALSSLWGQKLRSVLATLGIVIGVASLITMFSIGYGARAKVTASIQRLGTELVFIRPELPRRGLVRTGQVETLTVEDAEAIRGQAPGVEAVTADVGGSMQARYFSKNRTTALQGTTSDLPMVRDWKVVQGRFFNAVEVRLARKVAVLGETMREELFGPRSPIGERIELNGISFEVIGVMEEKGGSTWRNPDDQVIMPVTTALTRLLGQDHLSGITVKLSPGTDMDETRHVLNALLRTRHRIAWDQESDFTIRTQSDMLSHLEEVTGTFTALLAGVAAVSLIVGGIGIMNVMLVSVRERTREVGIRKALGARRRDIRTQFLVESMVMSLLGGGIGMALGIAVSLAVALWWGDWPLRLPSWSILLSAAYAGLVGLVFGVWPAMQAAALHPIEALRYE